MLSDPRVKYSICYWQVWREACAPLYHCRCTICQRASANANAANGNPQQQQHGQVSPVVAVPPQPVTHPRAPVPLPTQTGVTIHLEEAHDVDGDGEEELEILADEESEDEMDEVDDMDDFLASGSEEEEDWFTPQTTTPQALVISPVAPELPLPTVVLRPRKRSNDEVDREHEPFDRGGKRLSPGNGAWEQTAMVKSGTPPKRARRDEDGCNKSSPEGGLMSPVTLQVQNKPPLPRRMKKRNSEDLEEVRDDEGLLGNKRIKMSPADPGEAVPMSPLVAAPASEGFGESPPHSTTEDFSRSSSASLSN